MTEPKICAGCKSDRHLDCTADKCGCRCRTVCTICGALYAQHSGEVCPVCKCPVEHHDAASAYKCYEGRARFALCKRAAGVDLDALDEEAIRRFPNPPFLTANGYKAVS